MVEQRMSIGRMEEAINVFGSFDENIRLIESELHVAVTNRDGELKITGEAENVLLAARALKALLALSAKGEPINEQNVRYVLSLTRAGQEEKVADLARDVVCITAKGRPVKAKTIGQRKYVESIDQTGLIPKSRLYVHLSGDQETAIKVGKRHGEPIVYQVAAGAMARDGHKFWRSANDVWLTKRVPPEYLEKM